MMLRLPSTRPDLLGMFERTDDATENARTKIQAEWVCVEKDGTIFSPYCAYKLF